MSVLPHRIIVLASLDERGLRVDVPFIEDSVDGNGEEITVSRDNSLVGVQYRRIGIVRTHLGEGLRVMHAASEPRHHPMELGLASFGKPSGNASKRGEKMKAKPFSTF